MLSKWDSAARALLSEAGLRGAQPSAFGLARELGIDVVEADFGVPAQLVGVPPVIAVHPRLSRERQERVVALELGRWALRRAALPENDLAARRVSVRLVRRAKGTLSATRVDACPVCGASRQAAG